MKLFLILHREGKEVRKNEVKIILRQLKRKRKRFADANSMKAQYENLVNSSLSATEGSV